MIFRLFIILFTLNMFSNDISAEEIKCYTENVNLKVKINNVERIVPQKRWCIENNFVKIAVTDDPGGAVVAFINKSNGVNYVAGDVYSTEIKGKVYKSYGYWGWTNWAYDRSTDPVEQKLQYQPFKVEFEQVNNDSWCIKVTGHTKEQQVIRRHIIRKDSPELIVENEFKNISNHKRRIWPRWHPQIFPSKDVYGYSGCVLTPDKNDEVRKIRTNWGYDHWFRTFDGFWLTEDTISGTGLFLTYEKEVTPIHFTWTQRKRNLPISGAVTMESFVEPRIFQPGETWKTRFGYFPFAQSTALNAFPCGVLKDQAEIKRAKRFIRLTVPIKHLDLINRYTFSRSEQFNWRHRRRDKFVLKDWGFADCAIIGYPIDSMPCKVRMVAGVFDEEALHLKDFPHKRCTAKFRVRIVDMSGTSVYDNTFVYALRPGVPGENFFDRQVAIPMKGVPDGNYTMSVTALSPINRKPIHCHQIKVEIFGERLKLAADNSAGRLNKSTAVVSETPFVNALSKLDGEILDAGGAIRIPIGVEDASGTDRINFPVSLGVPFTKGAMQPGALAKLFSPKGKKVAASFKVMNIWPDKSLKWLRIDFQASCPANRFVFYNLHMAKKDVETTAKEKLIKSDVDNYIVDTGIMKVIIPKNKLSVPGKVYVDANKDGKFSEDELVMRPSSTDAAWWEDQNGVFYEMRIGGANSLGFVPGVSIEQNGSMSAVVKLQGWYSDLKNPEKHPAYGEIRLKFFKNKARIDLSHQVTFTGSPWHDRLASYGLKLFSAKNKYKSLEFDVDGQNIKTSTSASLFQNSYNSLTLFSKGQKSISGHHSEGALAMKDGKSSLLFIHKNLWQMYPKKIAADALTGSIVVSYWPKEAGIYDFAPVEEYWIPSSNSPQACATGLSRTQDMVLDFSAKVQPNQANAIFNEPLIACVPPKWVQKTDVLKNLCPYDIEKYPKVEEFVSLMTDYYINNRKFFHWYGQWDYGSLPNIYMFGLYNWLMVGRNANIGDEEDIVQVPWLLYFRSGDRKYLKFAKLWTRHLMEVQSIRWNNLYPEWIGMSRRHNRTAWLSPGDWGHTMLCPYLEYYHALGYRPAWDMALRTAESMRKTDNAYAGWRYISNPIIGCTRMYLETADDKYKIAADRMWNKFCFPDKNHWGYYSHGSRMAIWYSELNPDCRKLWMDVFNGKNKYNKLKPWFRYMDSFGELGKVTNDPRFAYLAMTHFDMLARTGFKYTGQMHGVNPIFRGGTPRFTQMNIMAQRGAVYSAEQVAKGRRIFPAGYFNGRVREIVLNDKEDKDITVYIGVPAYEKIQVFSPDNKELYPEIKQVTADIYLGLHLNHPQKAIRLYSFVIPKDGQKGIYRIFKAGWHQLYYIGSSNGEIALICPRNSINFIGSDPLYLKPEDAKNAENGKTKIIMNSSPGNSLEIFDAVGRRVFSKTFIRPSADATGMEFTFKLPDGLCKLGDKTGIILPGLKNIPLYINPTEIFDIDRKKGEK